MKLKTVYVCESCKAQSPKWLGQCTNCNAWNTFVEDVINVGKEDVFISDARAHKPLSLIQKHLQGQRIKSNINELDNVLGGGFQQGSLNLLGGEPGIGKSTLTLQVCKNLSENGQQVLYVSGEESVEQISQRASRIDINSDNLKVINENNLENIIATIKAEKPDIVIIDSIQVISTDQIDSMAGSISVSRFAVEGFMKLAKSTNVTIILIGHVTKEGNLAGPKVLEHLVDCVLSLEGDRYQNLRLLRAYKNRFGSCNEIGVFEMADDGLIEIPNPSSVLIESRQKDAIGSALSVTLEGNRPFVIEVQALTNTSTFGYPKRSANGFDLGRLEIIIAVLQKHCGVNLLNQDVYINIVGGLKIKDPAIDIAIAVAIVSSLFKKPLNENNIYIGEIGLCGEIRKVSQIEKRAKEVQKFGFCLIEGYKFSLSNLIKF